jgi:hypothetical protein
VLGGSMLRFPVNFRVHGRREAAHPEKPGPVARCRHPKSSLLSAAFTLKIALVDHTANHSRRFFDRGAVVLVTLNNPREKFWGTILDLTAAGLSVRGIDLNSFDDFAQMVRTEDPITPGAVFFPMHRVERMELDVRSGSIPSLCDRFAAKTGRAAAEVLDALPESISPGCTLVEAERRFVEATVAAMNDDVLRAAVALGITEEQVRRVLAGAPGSGPR